MNRANRTIAGAALIVSVLLGGMLGAAEAQSRPQGCLTGQLTPTKPEDPVQDLLIQGAPQPLDCKVGPGTYYFGDVNILKGGTLTFTDPPSKDNPIHFWAKSILVENGGALIAGSASTPIGAQGGVVTIHLYGADQGTGKNGPGPGKGIPCATPPTAKGSPCGIPDDVWQSDGTVKVMIPGVRGGDYFYRYDALPYDGAVPTGYFGYKVLAVSYGGTLQLFGKKGVAKPEPTLSSDSGTSWVRLQGSVKKGGQTLTVEVPGGRTLDWESEDKIVLTTTDYLPGHSEELTIDTITGNTITVKEPLKYDHNGVKYDMSRVPGGSDLM
jgi:G8 domain